MEVHVAFDLELWSAEDPFAREAVTHRGVDLGAQLVRGREDRGPGPKPRVEVEPEPGRRPGELVPVHLENTVAELLDRETRLLGDQVQHRGAQSAPRWRSTSSIRAVGIPASCNRAKGCRPPPRGAGAGRHQGKARNPRAVGDAHERPHLGRADHRGLVEDEERAAETADGLRHPLRLRDAVAHVAVAGEDH